VRRGDGGPRRGGRRRNRILEGATEATDDEVRCCAGLRPARGRGMRSPALARVARPTSDRARSGDHSFQVPLPSDAFVASFRKSDSSAPSVGSGSSHYLEASAGRQPYSYRFSARLSLMGALLIYTGINHFASHNTEHNRLRADKAGQDILFRQSSRVLSIFHASSRCAIRNIAAQTGPGRP
jgi:hypothetical protein